VILVAAFALPVPPHVNMLIDVFVVVLIFPLIIGAGESPVRRRPGGLFLSGWVRSLPGLCLHYPSVALASIRVRPFRIQSAAAFAAVC